MKFSIKKTTIQVQKLSVSSFPRSLLKRVPVLRELGISVKSLLIFLYIILLFGCSDKSELDSLAEKKTELSLLINELKATSYTYKRCDECKLSGFDEDIVVGFTDRYPPEGRYDRMEIEIGIFEYDVYHIFNSEYDQSIGEIYFCYFDQKQKTQFKDFWHYYRNRIAHGKRLSSIKYVNNTALITIEDGGW